MKNIIFIAYIIVVFFGVCITLHPNFAAPCLFLAVVAIVGRGLFSFDLSDSKIVLGLKVIILAGLTFFAFFGIYTLIQNERSLENFQLETIVNIKSVIWMFLFVSVGLNAFSIHSYFFEREKQILE